jgi:CRISPR-associated protein Cas5t
MFVLSIKGISLTASFRIPETHSFHQTLPLPPKTTIVGMIGAAKGLKLEDAHHFANKHNIQIGVTGKHKGLMRDLWNYRKITGKEKNYTPEDIKSRKHFSVLIREYLFHCDLTIVFGVEDKTIASDLRSSFLSPAFALTLGNSDDLFKIRTVSQIAEKMPSDCFDFENTILPGDITAAYKPDIDLKKLPVTETIRAPQVYLLPTKFTFEGEERRVAERRPFTFVGSSVKLNQPLSAYLVNGSGVILH